MNRRARILLHTYGCGSYTVVECTSCGPVAVCEGDGYDCGAAHLRDHNLEPILRSNA